MNKYINESSGLSPSDIDLLDRVQQALPLVADLCHADLLLYIPGNQPNTAVVIAQESPRTVSSVLASSMVGKQVGRKNEALVFLAFRRGKSTRSSHASPSRQTRTLQEAFPVVSADGNVIAVLSIEANLLEHDRLKRKSRVLRKSLGVIVRMAIAGQLCCMRKLTRVGEHDGLMIVDAEGQIQFASSETENLYRKLGHAGGLLGRQLRDMGTDESVVFEALEQGHCVEREIDESGLTWLKRAVPLSADNETPWLSHRASGNAVHGGAFVVINDITEQREKEQALKVKSAMIQEIHHRVKNNLQTIAALLRLQARRARVPEVETMLSSSVNRILSVAVVHEFLSHDQESVINIRDMCQRILDEVTHGVLDPEKAVSIRLEGENLYLPAQQATSCALIVNELLQNSVKHGYVGRTSGNVVVRLMDRGNDLMIEIADDGVGMPKSFDLNYENGHLGLQIIRTLVTEDLRGWFELFNSNGVTARVIFPRLAEAPTKA